jgi:hypothetical protein
MSYQKLEFVEEAPGELEAAFARARTAGWVVIHASGKPAFLCPPPGIRSTFSQARIERVWGKPMILPSAFYELYLPTRRMKSVVRVLLNV